MSDPGLLQELPDIAPLLPQGGGDRQQAAAADRTLTGLDAMTDLALNHGLAQSTLGCVVGGLDIFCVKERPQSLLRCSSCWQVRTVLAYGVRSPRSHPSCTICCKTASNSERIGRQHCCSAALSMLPPL